MRLPLVEDDTMIGEAVLGPLRAGHYAVDRVRDGGMADTTLRAQDYEHDGAAIRPPTREATVDGRPVLLTAREWAMPEPLPARPGVPMSRVQLEEKLYGVRIVESAELQEIGT